MKELLKQVGSKLEQLESDGFELEMAGLLGPPSGNDERVPVSKLKGVEFLRKPSPLVIVPFGQLSGPDEQLDGDPAREQMRKDLREYVKRSFIPLTGGPSSDTKT